jgi:transposase
VVGVEQWAVIRRMHRVERRSIREIHRLTGLHRNTIRRALASDDPPRYRRVPRPSKLDPLKPWIEEQLRAHRQHQAPARSPGSRRETVELLTTAEPVVTRSKRLPVQIASFECYS